jgi:hypothetical protein
VSRYKFEFRTSKCTTGASPFEPTGSAFPLHPLPQEENIFRSLSKAKPLLTYNYIYIYIYIYKHETSLTETLRNRAVKWIFRILIVGFCILLRVYPLILFLKPLYATNVFVFDFIVHYLQHVSAPIGGHLQVKCTQNILRRPLCV